MLIKSLLKLKLLKMIAVALMLPVLMITLTSCSKQIAKRNPALTKDCGYPELKKEHKAPRQRDVVNLKRGNALAECTERMRKLRK